jgi:hypothetical protein
VEGVFEVGEERGQRADVLPFHRGSHHTDLASTKERDVFADLHDSSTEDLDSIMLDRCRELAGEIAFMRGKLLGMIEGNHYWLFSTGKHTGKTSTRVLCELLDCPYLGSLCYLDLSLHNKTSGITVGIVATHGKSGGKLMGTPINQVDDLSRIFPSADIYLMGHDHSRGGLPRSSLYVSSKHGKCHLHQRRQWFARTGSFLKGYEQGVQSYIVDRLLRPSDLGIVRFTIEVARHREYHASGKDKAATFTADIHMWS